MDAAARQAAYEQADQQFPLIYKLVCPTCQTRDVGEGCMCTGNERTCVNGHRFGRCLVHKGYLVALPPSRLPRTGHCFESWLGSRYWKTDTRCACELAPVVWAMYRASVRDESLAFFSNGTLLSFKKAGLWICFVCIVYILVWL